MAPYVSARSLTRRECDWKAAKWVEHSDYFHVGTCTSELQASFDQNSSRSNAASCPAEVVLGARLCTMIINMCP